MVKNKYFRRLKYAIIIEMLIIESIAYFFIKLILFIFLVLTFPVFYFYSPMFLIDIGVSVEGYESDLIERLEFYGQKLSETKKINL
jgi:hypothetical protein